MPSWWVSWALTQSKWDVKTLLQEIEDLVFVNKNTAIDIESNIVGLSPMEGPSKQDSSDNLISRLRRIRDSLIYSNNTLSNINKTVS